MAETAREADDSLLPDFCNGRAVAVVVVIALAVTLVLTIAGYRDFNQLPKRLLTLGLFLQWMGLTSALVLCTARPVLRRLDTLRAALASLVLLLLTHVAIAEAAWQVAVYVGLAASMIPDGHLSFLIRNASLSLIISALVLHYFHLRRQWARRVALAAEARVDALTARIRPHFLFNSMNTIAALTRDDPSQAEAAVEDLSDLFRASLRSHRGVVSLRSELELAKLFERLEGRRLGSRLRVAWMLADLPMDLQIPSLTLQPLLENAIAHGVEQIPGGGEIRVQGRLEADVAIIEISNPTPPGDDAHRGEGLAVDNIRERLQLALGSDASLELVPGDDRFLVRLQLPVRQLEQD